MNQHPYLRAYMAGITIPTLVLLIATTAFVIARYVFNVPMPIERVIVFPLAVVPNVWGVWNIFWIASGRRIPSTLLRYREDGRGPLWLSSPHPVLHFEALAQTQLSTQPKGPQGPGYAA